MEQLGIVVILLAIVTGLAQVTDKIRVPYPILLVVTGMAISFIPNLPAVVVSPDLVFLVFLPPVLYGAAWVTSWPDFKANRRPITLLAVGCVLFTTTLVAFVAHSIIPNFGWGEAFVLGAIISPPDAVAATAATKGLNLPRRIITILEGESLVNDATGLIAYRYAIAATATGTFIFWLASINFFYVAGLGILIGFAIGYIFLWVHKITPDNPTTDTAFTLITPYMSYLVAEEFHASGVLAVVVSGLFLSWNSDQIFKHQTRIQAWAVWDTLIFLLNGIIFILIGLQLPMILDNISEYPIWTLIGYGALISLTTIVVRILWVFPGAYVPRWLSRRIRREDPANIRFVAVVSWSGMRGIVSLAAALALPLTFADGQPFPNRDLIIFLTFCVIFATLVLQGLTLPKLIKWLGIKATDEEVHEEHHARLKLTAAAIEHIEENYALLNSDVLNQIKTKYEIRLQRARKDSVQSRLNDEQVQAFHDVQRELIKIERAWVVQRRKDGQISEEVARKLSYELDLEETRLQLEQ
ncbi:MAG: Na+/H+ antiporter [Cyclobacteriaceae bacterium]